MTGGRLRWCIGTMLVAALAAAACLAGGPPAVVDAIAAGQAGDPVIAAAGDIACDPANPNFNAGLGTADNCRQKYVSDLLLDPAIAAVLLLGDNQYYCGGYQAFQQSYDLSWGRVKSITRPAVGNHEYLTSDGTDCTPANAGAAGYFNYFGAAAGDPTKGYYSYDIGAWHMIVLNSNCGAAGGCSPSSPQGVWLRNDLASHSNYCTLAYWHVPVFSSGGRADAVYKTFWDALYAADADVVLTAHDHLYERFAPQKPDGTADPLRGVRQWVVGTGGANHTFFTSTIWPNSEARNDTTYGVLRLTLHPTSYDWQFVPEAGRTYTDTGTGQCHGSSSDSSPPSVPTGLAATATAPNTVDLSWTASTDDVGVAGYRVARDGTLIATVTTTSYADTGVQPGSTHSYTVVAVDAGGNVSSPSNTASATTPPDTTPPTTPGNLVATAANAFRVDLTWNASTDDVGVVDYQIRRNGQAIATSTTTSFSDTTVNESTAYTYTVVARDTSNSSSPSNSAAVTTPAAATTVTLTPTADAYVQSDRATTNFGTATQLSADASPVTRILLKFTVSGVNGRPVLNAKLRLRCVNGSNIGGALHRVTDSSWAENTLTWSNQPTADTATIAALGPVSANTTYEIDLGALITGDGTYTIAIDSTSNDGAYYSSKEGTNAPELLLTLAPDALFADGFETGDLSKWTSVSGLAVQQQNVFAGSWAAESVSAGVGASASKQLSTGHTNLYYRIRLKLLSLTGTQAVNLLKFRTGTGLAIAELYVTPTGMLGYRNNVLGVSRTSTVAVPTGDWHEAQMHVAVNDAASTVEVWLDGNRVDALSMTDSLGTNPIGRIQLGENLTDRTYAAAFDTVTLDTSPISP